MANYNAKAQPRDAHGHFIKKGDKPQVNNQEKKEPHIDQIEVPKKDEIIRMNRKELLRVLNAKIDDMEKMNSIHMLTAAKNTELKGQLKSTDLALKETYKRLEHQIKLGNEQDEKIQQYLLNEDKMQKCIKRLEEENNKLYRVEDELQLDRDQSLKTIDHQLKTINEHEDRIVFFQEQIKKADAFGRFARIFMAIEAAAILAILAVIVL